MTEQQAQQLTPFGPEPNVTLEQVPAERIESGDEIMVDDMLRKVWSTGSGEYATTVRFDLGDRRQSFERQQPVWRVAGCPDEGQRVELAAKRIFDHVYRDGPRAWAASSEALRDEYRGFARAALGAVAASPDEPTKKENTVTRFTTGREQPRETWADEIELTPEQTERVAELMLKSRALAGERGPAGHRAMAEREALLAVIASVTDPIEDEGRWEEGEIAANVLRAIEDAKLTVRVAGPADEEHVDLFATDPLSAAGPRFVKRLPVDDPSIGKSLRDGDATYAYISEPHTMAECPFVVAGPADEGLRVTDAMVEKAAKALYDAQGKQHGGYERDVPRKGMQTYRAFEWEELAEIDKSGIRKHARVALGAVVGCPPEDEKP